MGRGFRLNRPDQLEYPGQREVLLVDADAVRGECVLDGIAQRREATIIPPSPTPGS